MKNRSKAKILTIPNILSLVRLCMVPLIVWYYTEKDDPIRTAVLLVVSGLTDVVDGAIARKFDMVSDVGKLLDPIADKLTQIAVLFCLYWRYPDILPLLILLCVKEIVVGITMFAAIRSSGEVLSANWHAKAAAAFTYLTMALHLVWTGIPRTLSLVLISICCVLIIISGVLYVIRNTRECKKSKAD